MKFLVVYASRYGATQGIAQRIATALREQGLEVDLQQAKTAAPPNSYDGVVIGSAAYFFHWMKPATNYVRRNRKALAQMPVWLFSSGALGFHPGAAETRDPHYRQEAKEIAEFRQNIQPRDHRVFFGAMDHGKLNLFHRLLRKLPMNKNDALFPAGDFRDWSEIDAWAGSIAQALQARQTSTHPAFCEGGVHEQDDALPRL
jgi:menaquinone-dependent protoporphyrinogen oxidase